MHSAFDLAAQRTVRFSAIDGRAVVHQGVVRAANHDAIGRDRRGPGTPLVTEGALPFGLVREIHLNRDHQVVHDGGAPREF